MSRAITLIATIAVTIIIAPAAFAQDKPTIDEQAERVLRDAIELLTESQAFRTEVISEINVSAEGMKQQMTSEYLLAVERPNRFAFKLQRGLMGSTIVSDGEKLYIHMPMMDAYTVEDAPESFADLPPSTSMGMSMGEGHMLIDVLFADDPYAKLTDNIQSGTYFGTTDVDGTSCHHLKLSADEMGMAVTVEMFIRADKQPVPVKIVPDMSALFEDAAFGAPEDMKMEMFIRFNNWQIDVELDDDVFSFTPPEGAEEIDSFYDAFDIEDVQQTHPMLGTEARDFTLETLEEDDFHLADREGEHIVILDFWATWCGPCVRALPALTKIADEYRDKGVVFVGVNQRESRETVRDFLQQRNLNFTVALDRKGEIGDMFGVEGIPQTVLIDKQGTIQSVHVGYMPGMENTLREEINALLEGKDIASEHLEKQQQQAEAQTRNVVPAWTVNGAYQGVATDPARNLLYAVEMSGRGAVITADGEVDEEFAIKGPVSRLRATNLQGDQTAEIVAFQSWGRAVTAYDAHGNKLWSYEKGQGIDDVWAGDLNGDDLDEVVIGYNGGTGLHALDNTGKPLWTYTNIANVWHVCIGDVDGEPGNEVVTTSAGGNVHVFNAEGEKLKDIRNSFYANLVRIGPGGSILASGGEVLSSADFDGNSRWSLNLEGSGHIDSAVVAAGEPWMALGMRGGQVLVVDCEKGEIIASVGGQGDTPQVGWVTDKAGSQPLLVVASGSALNAFRIARE